MERAVARRAASGGGEDKDPEEIRIVRRHEVKVVRIWTRMRDCYGIHRGDRVCMRSPSPDPLGWKLKETGVLKELRS